MGKQTINYTMGQWEWKINYFADQAIKEEIKELKIFLFRGETNEFGIESKISQIFDLVKDICMGLFIEN